MSLSRYSPEYVASAREQARDSIQRLLERDGLMNFGDLWRRLMATGGNAVADRKTFQRFYRHGPPKKPRDQSYVVLEAVATTSSDPDEMRGLAREFWTVSLSDRVASDDSEDINETWFAVVPAQDGRPYASIDHVEVNKLTLNKVTGVIRRLSPPLDRGHEWHFSGTRLDTRAIFLTFWPAGANNEFSRGTIHLLRASGVRQRHYEGEYRRVTESGELVVRTYGWYRTAPKTALHRVALLDLDNTLRASWSIKPWVEHLAAEGLAGAAACAEEVDLALQRFTAGDCTHDELAAECAASYAAMMKDKRQDEIAGLTPGFAADEDELYAFVRPLVACLDAHKVSPVLVSGAPYEVVDHYAKALGIEEAFGLRLSVDDDGRYTGDISANPGLTATKRETVNALTSHERTIVLAIGDSPSDRPLWQQARYRIIVGGLPLAPKWPTDRVLEIDPEESKVAEIVDWLNLRLDDEDSSEVERELPHDLMDQVRQSGPQGKPDSA